MVIRIEQCPKFETIPSIMHGTPQFDPIRQFKIGQQWRVERRKIPRLPGSLDHYSAPHYSDVIMSAMASQITGVMIVYSTVCSGADQRKHQSSVSLVCVKWVKMWKKMTCHLKFVKISKLWSSQKAARIWVFSLPSFVKSFKCAQSQRHLTSIWTITQSPFLSRNELQKCEVNSDNLVKTGEFWLT